jgi:hypothetical protein
MHYIVLERTGLQLTVMYNIVPTPLNVEISMKYSLKAVMPRTYKSRLLYVKYMITYIILMQNNAARIPRSVARNCFLCRIVFVGADPA